MKTKEKVELKESESDIRQRHDELCKLFIQMQTPMELSEETELELHEQEEEEHESVKPENTHHYKSNNNNKSNKRGNATERNYNSKGNIKFLSNTIKLSNRGKEHNYSINAIRNQSQEYKGQVRNFKGQRKSSKANNTSSSSIINNSTNKNKSSMDTKTLMLLAKNYQHKSLPPVFTEAGSTFKATQSSLRNVRDTLIHLTYDYSNSNEVALPMLTLQAIEESHKQFLHKLHPLSEEEKKQRDRRERQNKQENEKEQYYKEKYKEQRHVRFETESETENNWKINKCIRGNSNNILSELLAEQEEEEKFRNKTNVHNDNDGVIDKDHDEEEESIQAILELSSSNETEWNMYVKRARVVAADEFGQTFNPYQNSSLFMATSNNNVNSINYKNKKSVTNVPSTLINISPTKDTEHKKSIHGPFSDSVTSSTTNNFNTTNTLSADVINSIVNDPYFDDEFASLSDYAAEPTLHEFHNHEFDILANASLSNTSSSNTSSSFSSESSLEESEYEEKEQTEAAKDHVHHSQKKTQKMKKKKERNKIDRKSKDATQTSEIMNKNENTIYDTMTTTSNNTKLPFNAPNFLTNDLHLMQIEFAKVIRGVNRMMYINSYCNEWWNSATQTRRMKLNAIRSNYHARHANTLNDRIRQQLLLHAYYLNHYSARVRLELINQERQLRLFDDRFAESEERTMSLLHEVNSLQRELQEECTRRVCLQEEMKLLVKDNEMYEYHQEEEQELEEEHREIDKEHEEEKEKKKKKKNEVDRSNTVHHETKNKDEDTMNENVSNKESVDDPLRIELLLLLQNFPFPPELNKDVLAVQKWLQHNPQCCLS